MLTATELEQRTGKKRPSAQARQLRAWGVPFRVRLDGTLLVEWEDFREREQVGKERAKPALRPLQKRRVVSGEAQQVDMARKIVRSGAPRVVALDARRGKGNASAD